MADFLLELRCEEIPARMQAGARAELEKLFRSFLGEDKVEVSDLVIWSTPRRLVLIARGLPQETQAIGVEFKGPRVGAPDQAIEGFLRRHGVSRDELVDRDGVYFLTRLAAGRPMWRVLQDAVPKIVESFSWPKSMRWGEASITTDSLRWVRPLSGIVALLDGDVVSLEVGGIEAGRETYGHRFHASGPITIDSADDYIARLREAFVIVNHEERQDIIREGAAAAAAAEGLTLIADEGLVIENAGLTEWPVPLLGRFDEAYLDVPPEVIQLTARVNQKYFVCQSSPSGEGDHAQHGGGAGAADPTAPKLANAFVCTANIEPRDPAVVIDGNRKVLAARLSDARFFWEQDQKTRLEDHAKKLSRITFHEKLGTVADKVERVAKLARWLCEEGVVTDTPLPLAGGAGGGPVSARPDAPTPDPSRKREGSLADLAEAAARLCKADLVTEMVGEFPELQGLMGGYYAAKEGLPVEVAEAIRDHYKPVGQGDDVPTAPVTVAVSLADKLDTLTGFFGINEKPTGSKDPFALRRAALGIIRLVLENNLRFDLQNTIGFALQIHGKFWWNRLVSKARQIDVLQAFQMQSFIDRVSQPNDKPIIFEATQIVSALEDRLRSDEEVEKATFDFAAVKLREVTPFIGDRLSVQQREHGVRHDIIASIFSMGGEGDLVRLLARVHALQAFVTTEDGANLLAGYKRAANILKKEGWDTQSRLPGLDPGPRCLSDDAEEAGSRLGGREDEGVLLSYTPEEAERALIDALATAAPRAAQAVEAEQFGDAMAALATLRAPIDRFFEEVTVNAPEADKRAARLALLARFRDAVHRVADFSRIEG